MDRAEAVEALAKLLYERFETYEPGGPDDEREWVQLSDWEKGLYRNVITDLLAERALLSVATSLQ